MEKEDYIIVKNGGKLYYKVIGTGSPLIILHGGPGMDSSYLLPQMLELSKDNTLIFYDQRGSGKSTTENYDPSAINMNQFVDDLNELMEVLNIEKANFLGHSWGGYLGTSFALKYPSKVEKLILLATCPLNYDDQMTFLNSLTKKVEPIAEKLEGLFALETFQSFSEFEINEKYNILFSEYFFNKEDVQKLSMFIEKESAISGAKIFSDMKKTSLYVEGIDLFPDLLNFSIPTLIIHGVQDVIPIETARNVHRAISCSKMVEIDSCGHFPYIESPEIFFYAVRNFLTKNNI